MSMNPSAKRVSQLREEGDLGFVQARRLAAAEKRFDVLNDAHVNGDLEDKANAILKCLLSDARHDLAVAQEALPVSMRRNITP